MNKFIKLFVLISFALISCKRAVSELSEKAIVESSEIATKVTTKTGAIKSLSHGRNYSRTAINKVFDIEKKKMHKEALKRAEKENIQNALFVDSYTGKLLIGGIDNYEFDHVFSAEYLHSKYKSILTDEQIAQVVNCPENIITTSKKINRAKGNRPLEHLLNNHKKANELGINSTLANEVLKKADEGIKKKVSELILNN